MVYKASLGGKESIRGVSANVSSSIGIPLQKKISNSAWALNKGIGKSKSSSTRMTDGVPSTMTVFRSMQAVHTLSATHTMAASLIGSSEILWERI